MELEIELGKNSEMEITLEVTNCSISDLLQLDKLIYTAVGKIFKTYDPEIIDEIRARCDLNNVGVNR